MTPDEQNAAMAELEGWKLALSDYDRMGQRFKGWRLPGGEVQRKTPNYVEDLNAVARVEGKIPPQSLRAYSKWLAVLVDRFHNIGAIRPKDGLWVFRCATLPAAQRTEAILRATGKWKEEMLHQ